MLLNLILNITVGEKNSDSNENKWIVNYDYLFNNPDFYVCNSKQMRNFVYPNEENNVERKIASNYMLKYEYNS